MSRRRLTATIGGLTAALLLLAPTAYADPPSTPTLVAPADGSTSAGADVALAVRAGDPDGGPVDVRFVGRKVGATVPGPSTAAPFTLVALPDTQNYTYLSRQGTIAQQAQWVVDNRARLNTAMVVQLGDLVSSYGNLQQWGYTSAGLKVLDDAHVPNTVVAGNHDFDNATGAFSQYDTYFPPSRYADNAWTPSTARYGGYLGQNLFGPDPVDRRNMDSFALFSAGGRDFLVLNLEWEAPQYALDWAAKVLAAYPDRTAIMVTHSFVGLTGARLTRAERPGGTPVDQLWTDFVSQQCSIKLVLNGHYHDGNAGEANRSDLNRCGQPVQQILTDYQDRPNGGDGWLRYYTFDPATSTMAATTYSPKLDQQETDANSSFTVPFDLGTAPQPAPFATIGSDRVDSGSVARTSWTGLAPDTAYEWRAVVDDGTSTTTSPTWTVRTPPAGDVVTDTFSRDVTGGWGSADANHPWQVTSTASSYQVGAGAGRITSGPGATRTAVLANLSSTDQRVDETLSFDQAATGSGSYASVQTRYRGANAYRAKLRSTANGALALSLGRVVGNAETTLASANVAGVTVSPGLPLRVRVETTGASPTTLRAKVWPATSTEPSTWTVATTDDTATLRAAGSVALDLYASSTAAAAQTLAVDQVVVSSPAAPANQAPVAAIATPEVSARTVRLDGSGSTDPDGSIAAYRWDFGDGTSGAGATTTHTYAADGRFTVTLTVTDDKGATASATRSVDVALPADTALARDGFSRSTTSGWADADTGGAWTTTGASTRYAVADGTGRQVLSAGASADAALGGVQSSSTDLRATLSWNRTAAAGTLYAHVVPRRVSSAADYRCKVVGQTGGNAQLLLVSRVNGTETTLKQVTLPFAIASGQPYRVACRSTTAQGTTTLAGKLWKSDAAEPGAWQATAADSTASLQVAGGVGLGSYASSRATAGVTTSFDDLLAVTP